MDDIYYLVHSTNNPDCVKWDTLNVSGELNDQFPGVYMSVITKHNIDTESLFPGKFYMIFSRKLLQQSNYHLNIRDYNGIITERNTYYPWELDAFVEKLKENAGKKMMNEVIFHDPIPTTHCIGILSLVKKNILSPLHIRDCLPRKVLEANEAPDMTKKPFYCYPYENIYTGYDPLPKSSNNWFEMMGRVCKINRKPENTKNNIVKKIKQKAPILYTKRNNQNINSLKKFRTTKKRR